MVHLGVTRMPNAYILRRWTSNAEVDEADIAAPVQEGEMPEESRRKMKCAVYCSDLTKLAKIGCQTADGQRILSMHIKQLKTELSALKKRQQRKAAAEQAAHPSMTREASTTAHQPSAPSATRAPRPSAPNNTAPARATAMTTAPTTTNHEVVHQKKASASVVSVGTHDSTTVALTNNPMLEVIQTDTTVSGSSQTVLLHDPPISNTKGRKKQKAYQNPLDIQVKVKRKCRLCGSTQHDARNCPDRVK